VRGEGRDEDEDTGTDQVVPHAAASLPLVEALAGLVEAEALARLSVVTRWVLRCHGAGLPSRRSVQRA